MKITHSNEYSVRDIVVTFDGRVGQLLYWQPINTKSGPELLFITTIKNKETEFTGYLKNEIDIIPFKLIANLNKNFK